MKDIAQKRLVLLVDSEQDALDTISTMLDEAGFDCCRCANAEAAIASSRATPPDLIVCDLNLHGRSGIETCQQIRQWPGLEDVPVMFLSGSQLPDVIRRNHTADGGIYCLRKPLAEKVLVELIDQALGMRV